MVWLLANLFVNDFLRSIGTSVGCAGIGRHLLLLLRF